MAIGQCKDIENGLENGLEDLEKPFLQPPKPADSEDDESSRADENGNIAMVLLSTSVAVCGSFEFGSCVSIKISTPPSSS
jgi:MFS transporter, SP family, ERD6-like sugar transporter